MMCVSIENNSTKCGAGLKMLAMLLEQEFLSFFVIERRYELLPSCLDDNSSLFQNNCVVLTFDLSYSIL